MNPLPDTFHNPQLWPLLIFAFLPTLLYFIDRRRARRMDWPALQFFLTRQRARLRWIRFREALLIAVRSLALALMVYALLRPATEIEEELSAANSSSRGLVLVIDTSFSMSYHPDGDSGDLLARGKSRARALLEELKPTDTAVILAGGGGEKSPGELFDLEKTRRKLESLELTGGRFDLLRALDDAISEASGLPSTVREIYILTDQQADSLGEADDRNLEFLASRLAALEPAPSVDLIDCGVPEAHNHRIVKFESDSLVTGTDSAVGFRATVAPAPGGEDLHLRVTVNGEVIVSRPLAATKDDQAVSFRHRFSDAGTARVSAEIIGEGAGDGLPYDDARHLVIEVLDRLEVPILQDPKTEGRAGGGHWIDLALFPRYGEAHPPEVIFRPVILGSADSEILARARVLVLSGIRALEPRKLELIESFVERGGGLLIFADAETDRLFANESLWRRGSGLLPAELIARREAAAGETFHPVETDLEHPVFSIFKGVSAADLARLSIRSCWKTGPAKEKSAALSKTGDGSPWIIEHPFGEGKIVLFTTGATPLETDLPRTPLFVPLLHRLIRYLALGPSPTPGRDQGETLELALETGEKNGEARITSPTGETGTIEISTSAGKPVLRWGQTHETGFYSFEIAHESGGQRAVTLAVNMNPHESDLTRLETGKLENLENKLGIRRSSYSNRSLGGRQTVIIEIEHWPWALLLGLLLLLFELVLLKGFTSSGPAEPAGGAS